jgi:hypothetical protein
MTKQETVLLDLDCRIFNLLSENIGMSYDDAYHEALKEMNEEKEIEKEE